MAKFEEIANKWFECSRELREECTKYLKRVLKNKNLNFSDFEYQVSVVYIGDDPEFESNVMSFVDGAYLGNDGEVYLDIENDSCYPFKDLTTQEMYDVTDYIKNIAIPTIKERSN